MSHRIDPMDLRMARAQANRHGTRGDSDIESAAMRGLLEASRTYTPAVGTWRGYAHMRIKSRITDELRRRSQIPETPMTTEDMTQLATTVAPDPATFIAQLHELPEPIREDFAAGHIDRRNTTHRQALDTIKENLT
jgi:hypothetical protein